jgi:cell division protein FtsB
MDLNLKDIRFFSSEDEKRQIEENQLSKDSDFGNPHSELAMMHNATKWGIYFFASITLLSTAALIYRVTFPHLAEITGTAVATVAVLFMAFGAAIAIEVMLRGNWEPFMKKLFVTSKLDVVLGGLSVLFTGIILYGAITGMEVIADTDKNQPQLESVAKSGESTNAMIASNKQEIDLLRNGKGKGVYAWKGKPTPQANKRIAELEAQNTQALTALGALSKTTEATNAAKITTFNDKAAKAVHYLSMLAIGAEILKIIIFVFWGYRSWQLNQFYGSTVSAPTPLPQPIPQRVPQEKIVINRAGKNVIAANTNPYKTWDDNALIQFIETNGGKELETCMLMKKELEDRGYEVDMDLPLPAQNEVITGYNEKNEVITSYNGKNPLLSAIADREQRIKANATKLRKGDITEEHYKTIVAQYQEEIAYFNNLLVQETRKTSN